MSVGDSDGLRVIRERTRDIEIDFAADEGPNDTGGNPSCLVQTVAVGTYPTTASAFYMVKRVRPGGIETEGAAVSLTPYGNAFAAANLGTAVPPVGTTDIVTLADGRLSFRWDG